MYSVYVEDFMVRDVRYIWHGMSYGKLKEVLKENRNLRGFPLVDNPGECTVYTQCAVGSHLIVVIAGNFLLLLLAPPPYRLQPFY
jgi:hypothetical protein